MGYSAPTLTVAGIVGAISLAIFFTVGPDLLMGLFRALVWLGGG